MKHYTRSDIENMGRIPRLKLINAVSGIKPANLIGTISDAGQPNVAIFSSVVHLGSDPALLGFITRPTDVVPRHTYENIKQNHLYTINHVHSTFAKNAHYTSAKLDRTVSEFDTCALTEEYISTFKAPFVKESKLKMGMRFLQELDIEINGTKLIIGEIEHLIINEEMFDENQEVNLAISDTVGISGLNSYYSIDQIAQYPYVRENEIPSFTKI